MVKVISNLGEAAAYALETGEPVINFDPIEVFDAARNRIKQAWQSQQCADLNDFKSLVNAFSFAIDLSEDGKIDVSSVNERASWMQENGITYEIYTA